MVYITSIKLD
ncbi:hypothetical protein PENVUL_c282G01939 [Penicillium vulpinum]|uniref:Uncharacterized protein n=1 Tax=Penicillium vulpinum TaxID=29845 RepID=A0A1V6QQD5_9EURO|nr:hypothetical protein PENVUL_c282G01939 [Penicillium vulpinum]